MKRILLVPFLALTLALASCAQVQKVGDFVSTAARAVTTEFTNPVTPTNLYQAKLAFAASQEVVKKYKRDCFGSFAPPYPVSFKMIQADPVLSAQCSHRVSRYNAMKRAEGQAYNAVEEADIFIKNNPSGNAATYISAAIRAVINYQAKAGG